MKRITLSLALMLAVVAGTALTVMAAKEDISGGKGKEVTLTGRLSCTFCTFAHSGKQCNKGCCMECIKAGDPPLLKDEKGNMYILLGNEIKKPLMTPERMEMAGEEVTIKGLLVKGKGVQAIFVESIAKK
jgi:hypothetical protein